MTVNKITTPPTPQEQIDKINEIIDNLGGGGGGGSNLVYTTTCPALTSTDGVCTWTVTHNLGSQSIVTALYSGGNKIDHNSLITSNNAVTISFKASSNVSAGDFTIVVMAGGGSSVGDSSFLASGTTITVGTSGADYTTLADAYSYLAGKWSNGTITLSIITDLTITDNVQLNTDTFNIPQLVINGNNHTITINFTQSGTYTPGFSIFNYNPVKLTNINFIGGTNGTTHILIGGYYANSLYVTSCTFDGAYGGVFGYQGSDVMAESCTFLALQVGLQAQQSGAVRGRANTYGASGKQCIWAYNTYLGGFVRDGEGTYTNISTYSPSTVNAISSGNVILLV